MQMENGECELRRTAIRTGSSSLPKNGVEATLRRQELSDHADEQPIPTKIDAFRYQSREIYV